MSRTFRNRCSIPANFEVRDGGRVSVRGVAGALNTRTGPSGPWPRAFRRSVLRCEAAPARREHARWHRHVAKMLVRAGRDEEIPPFRGTSGYLTH